MRGGILDVFPPTVDHPLRVEFFGDEVEEVRSFSVADQRSLELAPEGVWAPPCRELLLTDAVRERALALKERLPGAAEMLDRIAAGIAVEGMESLAPALVDGMQPLIELLPQGTHVVVLDPERVRARAHDLVATTHEFLAAAWSNAAAGNKTPVDLSEASFHTLAQTRGDALAAGVPWWSLTSFEADLELAVDGTGGDGADDGAEVLNLGARAVRGYAGDVPAALDDLRVMVSDGWAVVITTPGHGPANRLVELLSGADVAARLVEHLDQAPEAGLVHVTTAPATAGFVSEPLRLALLTETDIIGRGGVTASTRDMRRMPSRRRNQVDPLSLRPGDHVVHEQHGVGRFVEMMQRTVGSGQEKATREYLVIEYAPGKRGQPGDRLFVPSDALDQVTRYVGRRGAHPQQAGRAPTGRRRRAGRASTCARSPVS